MLQICIRGVVEELEHLQSSDGEVLHSDFEASARRELLHLQKLDKDLWRQKSWSTWLTTRDLNTRFFHLSTVIRRRRNSIDSIKSTVGQWLHGKEAVGPYIINHFQSVFTSEPP